MSKRLVASQLVCAAMLLLISTHLSRASAQQPPTRTKTLGEPAPASTPPPSSPRGQDDGRTIATGQSGQPSERLQDELPTAAPINEPPSERQVERPRKKKVSEETWGVLSSYEFLLSIAVLLFGVGIFALEYLLLSRRSDLRVEDILRVIDLSMIVIAALLTITAGFSSQTVAPAMGLFGTIAGYLLGRGAQSEKVSSP